MPIKMTEDLLVYFKGSWKFEREIVFSESGQHYAKATGEASFDSSADNNQELQYKENGKVIIANASQQASFFRRYRYVFTAEGMDIYFDDELTQNFNIYQSYFYQSETHSLIAAAKHFCNKDVYEGTFVLKDAYHFVHTTLIRGPHKDYFITTHFEKVV